jgi:nucleoid-associated protein YgaU
MPGFAQQNVTTIDLGEVSDEELFGAMSRATEIELIMKAEWENNQVSQENILESQRLLALAEQAYQRGDYEAAEDYAARANALVKGETEVAEKPEPGPEPDSYPLPATFTVRSWTLYRDSLWTIAERPEIFGNPFRWPLLFDANRQIMPNPNNPDLIHPGMVLQIPSLDGEHREGEWQNGRIYQR